MLDVVFTASPGLGVLSLACYSIPYLMMWGWCRLAVNSTSRLDANKHFVVSRVLLHNCVALPNREHSDLGSISREQYVAAHCSLIVAHCNSQKESYYEYGLCTFRFSHCSNVHQAQQWVQTRRRKKVKRISAGFNDACIHCLTWQLSCTSFPFKLPFYPLNVNDEDM